jgi:hypothetical protein
MGTKNIVQVLEGVQGILNDLSASACYAERHCIEHRKYNKFENVPKTVCAQNFICERKKYYEYKNGLGNAHPACSELSVPRYCSDIF